MPIGRKPVGFITVDAPYSVRAVWPALASDCTISGTPTRGQGALPYRFTADTGSDTVSGEVRIRVLYQPRFVYAANSGSNNVSFFAIDQNSGALSQIAGSPFGSVNDAISVYAHPSGRFVYYAQYFAPAGAVGFSRESASGALNVMSGSPFAAGLAPGFITGDVFGRFVYVANSGDTWITVHCGYEPLCSHRCGQQSLVDGLLQ